MNITYRTSSFYHTNRGGYIGSVRFYETWKEGEDNPTNSMFKRFLYRLTTDIVRTSPQDAQLDAAMVGDDLLAISD